MKHCLQWVIGQKGLTGTASWKSSSSLGPLGQITDRLCVLTCTPLRRPVIRQTTQKTCILFLCTSWVVFCVGITDVVFFSQCKRYGIFDIQITLLVFMKCFDILQDTSLLNSYAETYIPLLVFP